MVEGLMNRLDLPPDVWRVRDQWSHEFSLMAHDIRSALNGVVGGVALLDRTGVDVGLHVHMDRVNAAAEALALLLEKAVGEATAPAVAVDEGPVRLADFLGFVGRRWSGEAEARGMRLRVEAEPGLPEMIRVDWLDLCRILGNLMANAVKYGTGGTILVAARHDPGAGLSLSVADEGPGLGGRDPETLFACGARNAPGGQPGAGLGLYIARDLAERIGGRLVLSERQEGGAVAVLHLPEDRCVRDGEAIGSEATPLLDLTGRRILLAEDNPTNQMVASQMLDAMRAEVVVASDGIEALARFEEGRFDLLVIDIEMPRMSGLDVIRSIRARTDHRARTPIIALTAYALKEHRLRIAEAGADGLISKPIMSTDAFGEAISQHLRDPAGAGEPVDPETLPAIDATVYGSLAGTIGADLMAELLDRIVADLDASRIALEGARDPLCPTTIRTHSHVLISVAGAFGAARLRCRASRLNAAAHEAPGEPLAAELRACLAEIVPAIAFARAQRAEC
jgi:two-component system, OmpR family, aerobic respiration control sensor histidine kinase ArcB